MNKSFVRRTMILASVIAGLIAAIAIYAACTFGRCPRHLDSVQFAILFFFIVTIFSYLIKQMMFK